MRKRISLIVLSLVLALSMCMPAMAYTAPTEALADTSGLLADDAENFYGVKGTPTVDGTMDPVWSTAFAINFGGKPTAEIYILWDETNLYILEKRSGGEAIVGVADSNNSPNTWSAYDASLYNIVLPAKMEANQVAAILFNVGPRDSLNSAAVGTIAATRIWVREAKITSNLGTSHTKDANYYTDAQIESSVWAAAKSFTQKTSDGYLIETSIPWSALAHRNTATAEDTNYTGSIGDVLGIKCYIKHQGDSYVQGNGISNQSYNTNDGYTANGNADQNGFSPLHLVETAPIATDGFSISISNATELKAFFAAMSALKFRFRGYTINLTDDIDLNPGWDASITKDGSNYTVPETPEYVFEEVKIFQGTLDGNGHTISGLYFEKRVSEAGYIAPFYYLHGTIRNIAFVNSLVMAMHTNGSGTNLVAGCTISGLAAYMKPGSELNTVYSEINVWARSWSGQNLAGLVGYIENNPTYFRKVVVNATIGGSQPNGALTAAVDTSQGTKVGGLIFNANWKTECLLDQVVVNPTVYVADDVSTAPQPFAASSQKFASADMADYAKPNHNVAGAFDSYEDAEAAGAALDTKGGAYDYTFSPRFGGIIPTALVHMVDYNLFCQQTEAYTASNSTSVIDVRLLSTIDSLDICDEIGFAVSVKIGDAEPVEKTVKTSMVFSSIQAAGKTVTAEELGGAFITALVVKSVPATGTVVITVTPIKILNTVTYSDPTPTAITIEDGVIVH